MNEQMQRELSRLAALDEDELLLELARALPPDQSLGIGSPDPDEKKKAARNWLRFHYPDIRKHLCASPAVRKYISDGGTFDRITAAAAVLDGILSTVLQHIPAPLVVATLVSREGLRALCGGMET